METPPTRRAAGPVRGRPDAVEPWPGYDGMTVHEVQAALREVDEAERDAVLRYEQAHRARKGVLSRRPR